jgi:hypothetical protein
VRRGWGSRRELARTMASVNPTVLADIRAGMRVIVGPKSPAVVAHDVDGHRVPFVDAELDGLEGPGLCAATDYDVARVVLDEGRAVSVKIGRLTAE